MLIGPLSSVSNVLKFFKSSLVYELIWIFNARKTWFNNINMTVFLLTLHAIDSQSVMY